MGNAAFALSKDEDGSRVRPDSRGIWTASVIEVGALRGGHKEGYLLSAFLAGRGQLRIREGCGMVAAGREPPARPRSRCREGVGCGGAMSLRHVSCHKKKGKGRKKWEKNRKNRRNNKKAERTCWLCQTRRHQWSFLEAVGVVAVSCKDRCKSVLSFHVLLLPASSHLQGSRLLQRASK